MIIVPYFELLCNYPKIPQIKNYEIQGVNRVSKCYFTKIKTVGTPSLKQKNYELNIFISYVDMGVFLEIWGP